MRASVILCICSLFVPLSAFCAIDKELTGLEEALKNAKSQTEMNLCSSALAECLDARLCKLEARVEKDEDSEGLSLFQKASKAFRKYRASEVKSEGDMYRGGSIQPLSHNMSFIRLTKERIEALRERDPEGRYRDG